MVIESICALLNDPMVIGMWVKTMLNPVWIQSVSTTRFQKLWYLLQTHVSIQIQTKYPHYLVRCPIQRNQSGPLCVKAMLVKKDSLTSSGSKLSPKGPCFCIFGKPLKLIIVYSCKIFISVLNFIVSNDRNVWNL